MSKYNNKRMMCKNRHYHDSKWEAEYCDGLALKVKAGVIKHYAINDKYSFTVNNVHICNHIVDFAILTNDDVVEVHDTKGVETDVWKLKYKLFRALYPNIKYKAIKKYKREGRINSCLKRKINKVMSTARKVKRLSLIQK